MAIDRVFMASGHGFQLWNLLGNEFLNHNPHIAGAAIVGGILTTAAVTYRVVAPALGPSVKNDKEFVPSSNFSLKNIFEVVGEFVQGMAKDIIGHHYKDYLPLLIFIFMWTFLNNFLGMIPTLGSATDNINTTLAMGAFVFLYYNFQGFKSNGFKYLEHYTGHLHGLLLLFLGPIMFLIELVSHGARPVTLGIRLRSNIYGDHKVLSIISGLFGDLTAALTESLGSFGQALGYVFNVLGPLPIMFLGLMVCVVQAFVFMLLTTIYIGMATAHDDH
jgi:F-type H+-transporting ATPase subunit a